MSGPGPLMRTHPARPQRLGVAANGAARPQRADTSLEVATAKGENGRDQASVKLSGHHGGRSWEVLAAESLASVPFHLRLARLRPAADRGTPIGLVNRRRSPFFLKKTHRVFRFSGRSNTPS